MHTKRERESPFLTKAEEEKKTNADLCNSHGHCRFLTPYSSQITTALLKFCKFQNIFPTGNINFLFSIYYPFSFFNYFFLIICL